MLRREAAPDRERRRRRKLVRQSVCVYVERGKVNLLRSVVNLRKHFTILINDSSVMLTTNLPKFRL